MHSRMGEQCAMTADSPQPDAHSSELLSVIAELDSLLDRVAALKQTLPAALIDEALVHLKRVA